MGANVSLDRRMGLAWWMTVASVLGAGAGVASLAWGDGPGWRTGPSQMPLVVDDETMARQLRMGARRCQGTYANTLLALSPTVAAFESQPGKSFVYCVRNTATYEQVYYGRDGKLKNRHLRAVAHGTAFAYRWQGQETLLLTNHHVATWPEVTDEENRVSGVPPGARKVSESLQIVRNDEDDYEPGYVALARVATDPTLDAAVLKARTKLNVLPYAVGSSAALTTGTAVEVRGYPLGAFAAANVGKVTNPYLEDLDGVWNHVDFAFDALVNRGNSGSPVLAVSCLTGEYELVGLFHAGYREGEAMNLAVGIDDLRMLMDRLTSKPRQRLESVGVTDEARAALASMLGDTVVHMRFGKRMVEVSQPREKAFSFRIFGENYPTDTDVFVRVDEPVGRTDDAPPVVTVYRALEKPVRVPESALDAESREHLDRLVKALLLRLARSQQYKEVAGTPPRTQARHKRAERLLKEMSAQEKEQEEMLGMLETHMERAWAMMRSKRLGEGEPAASPAAASIPGPPSEPGSPADGAP